MQARVGLLPEFPYPYPSQFHRHCHTALELPRNRDLPFEIGPNCKSR
jgi:hypothetical protein